MDCFCFNITYSADHYLRQIKKVIQPHNAVQSSHERKLFHLIHKQQVVSDLRDFKI